MNSQLRPSNAARPLPTAYFPVKTFSAGQSLHLHPNYVWQLASGIVKTFTYSDSGTITALGYWGSDDIVGGPLIGVTPFETLCVTRVSARCVPLLNSPNIVKVLVNQMTTTQQLMATQGYRRVSDRFTQVLHWLAHKFGRMETLGFLIDVPITHQELADLTGTTRVTVTRLLSDLSAQGLIRRTRRRYFITAAGLQDERFAALCPDDSYDLSLRSAGGSA